MAIRGTYNYKGIEIPNAYARVVTIHNQHKTNHFSFQLIVYVDTDHANIGIDNSHFQLHQEIFTDVMIYDYSIPLQTAAYNYLKGLDRFRDWEDC